MSLEIKVPKSVFDKGRAAYKENPSGQLEDVKLDPGRHVAIVVGARAVKTDQGPQIVIDCKVAGESAQAGGRVSIWFMLSEDRIVYLFRCLKLLGYEVDELDDKMLAEILEDLKKEKPVVRLTAKQKGEYVNVYLDKKLDDAEAGDARGDSGADSEAGGGKAGVKTGAHAKADDLADLDRDELKKIAEDEEVDIVIKKSTSEDDIRDAIRAKRGEIDGEEAKKAAADALEKKGDDDLDEKDRDELKALIEEEEVDLAVKKSTTEDEMREAIREHRAKKGDAKEPDPSGAGDSVELEIGMQIKAVIDGKKVPAKVVNIDEKKGVIKVKTKDGGIHKVTVDEVELE